MTHLGSTPAARCPPRWTAATEILRRSCFVRPSRTTIAVGQREGSLANSVSPNLHVMARFHKTANDANIARKAKPCKQLRQGNRVNARWLFISGSIATRWRIERPRDRSRVAKPADAGARRLRVNDQTRARGCSPDCPGNYGFLRRVWISH